MPITIENLLIVEIDEENSRLCSDFLRDIVENEFAMTPKVRPDIDDPLEYYSHDRYSLKVALLDGDVVGTCGLIGKLNNVGYLKRMYVSQRMRGSGVGALLLKAVVDQAKVFGMNRLFLGIDPMTPKADTFYSQHGFTFALRPDVPEDIPSDGDTRWMFINL